VCVVVFLQAYIDYVKEQKFRQLNSIKVGRCRLTPG
jgi:Ca2+-transporting ATPase